jgi:ribosomal protein S18 acetylase RimI-like enzyme
MAKVQLVPIPVDLNGPVFNAIVSWPFEEEFVVRILTDDIPQRVKFESARIWAYRDPDANLVGFGTLSICGDWREFTDGKSHTYIPLLAVHPERRGLGYGKAIVDHLVDEAAGVVNAPSYRGRLHSAVFLDVYESSTGAIKLYQGQGFRALGNGPFVDEVNHEEYFVMAKRVTSA